MQEKKKHLADAALIGALLVLSLGVLLLVGLLRRDGAYVEVTLDGELVGTYSLAERRSVEIGDGGNVLIIEDGAAYLSYADCPDQTCVRTGKISYSGQTIVCLPNRVVVRIVGDRTSDGVDLVS